MLDRLGEQAGWWDRPVAGVPPRDPDWTERGLPIEDVGVAGTPSAMTRDDVLHANQDLIAESIAVLQQQPLSRLTAAVDTTRSIEVTTSGLDHLDLLVHGHPGSGQPLTRNTSVTLVYPRGCCNSGAAGFSGGELRQRRRFPVGS